MRCGVDRYKYIRLHILLNFFFCSSGYYFHDIFGANPDGTDTVGGVIQQIVDGMHTLNHVGLRLVVPFTEFPPKASKKKIKRNRWGLLIGRLCLHFELLIGRLCLLLFHAFPSYFVQKRGLVVFSKGCLLIAAFVCNLNFLFAVFLNNSLPAQHHFGHLFPARVFGYVPSFS